MTPAAPGASARVLMAAHPTAGHTNALRAIGARLLEDGHAVAMSLAAPSLPLPHLWPEPLRVASTLPAAIEAQGITLRPLRPSPGLLFHAARITRKTGYDELAVAIELFTSGAAAQATELARHAASFGADVIVADYLMPAAMLAAKLAALPYVAVYHSALPFETVGGSPFGSGLSAESVGTPAWTEAERALGRIARRFEARVQTAARSLGLGDVDARLTRPTSRDLNLLLTRPELEPGLLPLTGPTRMIGPCLARAPQGEAHAAMQVLRSATSPRIYVSLGTVFNDQPRVFDNILEGLATFGACVVVSAGASFERLHKQGRAGVHVFRQVPQVQVLSEVDLVITHGGNNTVQECLAAGRPMVVVPFGGDQIDNARRVERLGVGVCVRAEALRTEAFREAVSRARSSDHMTRANALREALAGCDGARDGARAILDLVAARSSSRSAP